MPNNTTSEMRSRESALAALTEAWKRWRRNDTGTASQAEAMVVGALSPSVLEALRKMHRIQVQSAAVTVTRREVHHLRRNAKATRGTVLADADLDRLPGILASPEAVLFDTGTEDTLTYVFTPSPPNQRKGKIAVRVNFTDRLKLGEGVRQSMTTNSMRSAGYVDAANLREARYATLLGNVE